MVRKATNRGTLPSWRARCRRAPCSSRPCCATARRLHGDSEVVTWTAEGPRRLSYRDVGQQAAQLAHALRGLGITGDQRVGTFMWNNTEHLTAYLAVPSMGAVLHALNIRLYPEQLVYVARHGGSEVVIVDNTLAAPFAKLVEHLPAVRHVIVSGPVDDETRGALALPPHVEAVHDYATLLADQPTTLRLAGAPRREGRVLDVLHLRNHRQPQGCRVLPPWQRAAQHGRGRDPRHLVEGPAPHRRAALPRQRLGLPLLRHDHRGHARHAGPVPPGRAAGRDDRGRTRHGRRRRADDLERPAAPPRRARVRTCRAVGCSWSGDPRRHRP